RGIVLRWRDCENGGECRSQCSGQHKCDQAEPGIERKCRRDDAISAFEIAARVILGNVLRYRVANAKIEERPVVDGRADKYPQAILDVAEPMEEKRHQREYGCDRNQLSRN